MIWSRSRMNTYYCHNHHITVNYKNKYNAIVYSDGVIFIFDKSYCFLFETNDFDKFNEEYIDKIILLK